MTPSLMAWNSNIVLNYVKDKINNSMSVRGVGHTRMLETLTVLSKISISRWVTLTMADCY